MSGAQYQVHVHGGDLYRPANDPRIVPLGPELILPQKVRNGVDFMNSLWMEILIYLIILAKKR